MQNWNKNVRKSLDIYFLKTKIYFLSVVIYTGGSVKAEKIDTEYKTLKLDWKWNSSVSVLQLMENGLNGRSGQNVAWRVEEGRSVTGLRTRLTSVTPQNAKVGSMIGKQVHEGSCCRQRNAYWSLISFVKLRIIKNTLKYHLVISSCEVLLTNDKESCFYVAIDGK